MIFHLWWKKRGWKFRFRFKKPVATFIENGCFSNECEGGEECECNNFKKVSKDLTNSGFILVGHTFGKDIWANKQNEIVHVLVSYGR